MSATQLHDVVKRLEYDARTVGTLHGRRAPHLHRDAKTGDSSLTTRGSEIARQFLFVARLTRTGLRDAPPS